ncbi:hypothetical protein T05_11084 [Trichinella murrelli]|nr:hypothetical protein T05_11084 [Trichinella murrelli]
MPTLLRISISPDAFVFSLAFQERPSDTHRCTVAESAFDDGIQLSHVYVLGVIRAQPRRVFHDRAADFQRYADCQRAGVYPNFGFLRRNVPSPRAQGHASSPPARSPGSALSACLRRSPHPSSLWRR